jgi:MraZ protein
MPLLNTYNYNLDSKNRIFIPAKHREVLGANFVVFPNLKDTRSLVISSVEYFNSLIDKIRNNEELSAEDRSDMIDFLSGFGDTVTTDTQGRIVLAANLVSFAELGGATIIRGCQDHVEIWSAAVFTETPKEKAKSFADKVKKSGMVL